MFVSKKSQVSLKMGHARSKTRTLSQTLKKPRVPSRGQIFSLIVMKHGQNVCLSYISDTFKMGLVKSKTMSLSQILEKPCERFRGHIFSSILLKLGQKVCFDNFLDKYENGSYRMIGWLVVLRFNVTLTAKVISWRSVTNMCVSWLSHTSTNTTFLSKATDYLSHMLLQR